MARRTSQAKRSARRRTAPRTRRRSVHYPPPFDVTTAVWRIYRSTYEFGLSTTHELRGKTNRRAIIIGPAGAKATAQGTVDDVSSTDDDRQDYRTERYDELEDEAEDEEGAAAVEMKKFAKKEAKGVLGGTLRDVRRLLRDCDCVSFVTAAYAAAQTVHDYLIAPFKEVGTGVVERRSRVPPIHSSSSTHQINESTDGSALVVGTTHTNDERPVRP